MSVLYLSYTHTHTPSVAPQLCALSGCWQVGGGISEWSSFASTALMPQTKCAIQQGFPEQARGWSDCLPDWLRSDCKTCIFVSEPPFLPFGWSAHEYAAFHEDPESLIVTTHFYAWILFDFTKPWRSPNPPKSRRCRRSQKQPAGSRGGWSSRSDNHIGSDCYCMCLQFI